MAEFLTTLGSVATFVLSTGTDVLAFVMANPIILVPAVTGILGGVIGLVNSLRH